jgi:hypothetical protein
LSDLAELRDWGTVPSPRRKCANWRRWSRRRVGPLVERDIAAAAQRLGVPSEVAHTYITTQVADAARFWAELGTDPTRMATEVKVAKARWPARRTD